MRTVSIPQMIELEENLFKRGIYTAEKLMNIVGYALARMVVEEYPRATEFLIFVGKGNNGGDGLVMARALAEINRKRPDCPFKITVYQALTLRKTFNQISINDDLEMIKDLLGAPQLGPPSMAALKILQQQFPEVRLISPTDGPIPFPNSEGVVIDALLGIQAKGPLRPPLGELVAQINQARRTRFFRTVAVDLPSGLGAYITEPEIPESDACIVADLTATAGYAKSVLCREALSGWVGRLVVLAWPPDSEEPRRNVERPEVLVPFEVAALLPRRNALSYKGTFGHLLIVAGSPGFSGAAVLCAQAAQAMGAGLISVLIDTALSTTAAPTLPPEVMVVPLHDKIAPDFWSKFSVAVFGPGTGTTSDVINRLNRVIKWGVPLVIDADGLNILSQRPDLLSRLAEAQAPVVLTPHTGEMARLHGSRFSVGGREWVAREFVEKYRVTLVLKGTRTIVTGPGEPIFYNTTGNPGLATGGSGDTLAGMIGALLAQGLSGMDAARLGVWLHGHAGDLLLRERGCEEGMTPTQVAGKVGQALVSLRAKAVLD